MSGQPIYNKLEHRVLLPKMSDDEQIRDIFNNRQLYWAVWVSITLIKNQNNSSNDEQTISEVLTWVDIY